MQRKRNLNCEVIVSVAADLIEEVGYENLAIRSLADALDVKPPSLYNHFDNIDDIKKKLSIYSIKMLGDTIRNAAVGRSSEEAIREIAYAYRSYAKDKKELYKAFTCSRQIEKISDEAAALVDTLRQVLKPFDLAPEDEIKFLVIFRTGIHGFVSLENIGAFKDAGNLDTDMFFDELVEKQIIVLKSYQTRTGR